MTESLLEWSTYLTTKYEVLGSVLGTSIFYKVDEVWNGVNWVGTSLKSSGSDLESRN